MLSQFSSNATLTKTRAMSGKRLTGADYNVLLSKTSVGQVAAYLKAHPGYRDALIGVNEGQVHRRELEWCIRQKHFDAFSALGRYELSVGDRFVEYMLLTSEIELILGALTRLRAGAAGRTELLEEPYLKRHLRVDADRLETVLTYEDVLEGSRDSAFAPVLRRLVPEAEADLNVPRFESALYAEFYAQLFQIVDQKLSGTAQSQVREFFVSQIDLRNLIRIYRLKKFYGGDPAYVRAALLPKGSISQKTLDALLQCPTAEAVLERAGQDRHLHKQLQVLAQCRHVDDLPEWYLYQQSLHNIRFSPHPAVVMLSYLNMQTTEISNLIKIIEGIRYGMPAERIRRLLITETRE